MHLALYRKYRSATFDEVISQEHITTTLKNQIKAGTPAHAYLFTGSRGTGKTTCAKLMAKAVNCLSPVDGNPCGECESCKAIADGCPDIIEMDAASNNGVDDVRALRDEVMYAPTMCKYKVYIIDEVHMLSPSAFNALLKTIEEPPPHVIFILATTEIHKVPATIASRCQQFRFSRIDVEESTRRLCEIAQKENVKITEDAARLISRLSDGGMRDAVSLLDQCISVSGDIDEETVRTTAGIAGTEHLFTLAQCIHEQNAPEALRILDELHNQSKDLMLLLDELLSHFRNLCMLSATDMDFSLIPAGSGTRNDLARQTKEFTLGEIMRCMDILQDCIARTPKTAKRRTVAEMCLIRLCTPRLDSDTSALSLRLEKLENKLDRLCDGEIKIQPRSAVPISETTQSVKSVSKPAVTASDKPQNIISDTLNKIENKISAVTDRQEKATATIAPVQQTSVNQNIPDNKPDWLFEGTGGDTADNIPVSNADSGNNGNNAEIPPFDLDEPPINAAPAEQAEQTRDIPPEPAHKPVAEVPKTQGTGNSDPQVAEILDRLPVILQAILGQVSVTLGESTVNISGYQKFQYDFLTTGDSKERLEKAAEEVTGRRLVMTFDNSGDTAESKDKSDPVSDFLSKAEKMGVKIKYKKAKN